MGTKSEKRKVATAEESGKAGESPSKGKEREKMCLIVRLGDYKCTYLVAEAIATDQPLSGLHL